MPTLLFSPRAVLDIEAIWDYSADRWGMEQADRYVAAIRAACEAVAAGERIAQDASTIRAGYRRLRSGQHVIFLRLPAGGDSLEVVRVLHGRMDIPAHLEEEAP